AARPRERARAVDRARRAGGAEAARRRLHRAAPVGAATGGVDGLLTGRRARAPRALAARRRRPTAIPLRVVVQRRAEAVRLRGPRGAAAVPGEARRLAA